MFAFISRLFSTMSQALGLIEINLTSLENLSTIGNEESLAALERSRHERQAQAIGNTRELKALSSAK